MVLFDWRHLSRSGLGIWLVCRSPFAPPPRRWYLSRSYSAKRGFWFSHIGWMLKTTQAATMTIKYPRFKADPVLVAQDKYYALWILLANIGLPALFGWMVGDVAGTLVLCRATALCVKPSFYFLYQLAFAICLVPVLIPIPTPRVIIRFWRFSLGAKAIITTITFSNTTIATGVKWWQYDPSKWIIYGLSKIGLTWDLKRIPDVTIQHAQTEMAFKLAEKKVATFSGNLTSDFQVIKDRLNSEQQAFKQTIAEWQALKTQTIEMKKKWVCPAYSWGRW